MTIVIGRTVAREGLSSATTLSVRFGVAAAVLFALIALRKHSLLPAPGERTSAFLLGAVGYMVESTLFYMGLERGTAAAVSLLFYAYPAVVTVLEVALGRTRPSPLAVGALALAVVGTIVVVVSGGDVAISASGIAFSLASAVSFAVYLLVSHSLMRATPPPVTAAWVAGGAALGQVVRGFASGTLGGPGDRLVLLVLNGIATAAAFGLMFAALRRLGPGPTAVVMTLEAVFAVLLAAVFLDEGLTALQAAGGLAVLVGATIVSLQRDGPEVEADLPVPG